MFFKVSEISVGGVGVASSLFVKFQPSSESQVSLTLTFIQQERPEPAKVILEK